MKKQLLSICTMLLFCWACNGDFLTVEETGVIPSSDAPIVTAFLSPQDTIHTVTLYHTRPAAGNNPYATWEQNVSKSTVTLSNGTQTVKLIPDSFLTGVFKISSKNFKVESGKTYYLNVSTFDGKKVEANCTIPTGVVDTTSIAYQLVSGNPSNMNTSYLISWKDIPNQVNYYAVYTISELQDLTKKTAEINNERYLHGIDDVEKDGLTVGTQESLLLTKPNSPAKDRLYIWQVQVLNTDIHFYKFHKDYEIAKQADENPFSEPVMLYSNIKGGFGVMAGYTKAVTYFR
ncbi:MAG: DUF4249 domain-containing protein [Flectobacillus sp.]|uniref:DUF4249 domain-containing protein n=1 Tax=Flectobacillus sp. TaxID=50419 RepID=UPI003B9D44E8